MHDYDVHEAFYLEFEIHDPWIKGSGQMAGSTWPFCKTALKLRFCSILLFIKETLSV